MKSVFIEQLSPGCRAALAVSNITDVAGLAEAADKYMDAISVPSQVAAVDQAEAVSRDSALSKLVEEISGIGSRLQKLELAVQKQSRSKPRFQRRSKSRATGGTGSRKRDLTESTDDADYLCFLHAKYGTKARSCRGGGCTLKSENSKN